MQYQILLFILQFTIYYNDFVNAKALIGDNVRRARSNEYTFVACLIRLNLQKDMEKNIFCAATIISKLHALTAAHCLNTINIINPFGMKIGTVDIRDGPIYFPHWYISYNQWASGRGMQTHADNDIGIIKTMMEIPAQFGKAEIPKPVQYNRINRKSFTMVGWGKTLAGDSSRYLQAVNTTIITNTECEHNAAAINGRPYNLAPTFLCSKTIPYALMSVADSGGPLLSGDTILAVNKATYPRMLLDIYTATMNAHVRVDFYDNFISNILIATF